MSQVAVVIADGDESRRREVGAFLERLGAFAAVGKPMPLRALGRFVENMLCHRVPA